MLFQWYLFVLVAVVAYFAHAAGMVYEVNTYGTKEKKYTWLPALIIIIPMIYLAATRVSMNFGDTSVYASMFSDLPTSLSEMSSVISSDTKDRGFTVFSVILKSFIGNNVTFYFGIIAGICILSVAYTYKKLSCNFAMSMFLFIASGEYLQWNYNGIRQFIAVALLFASAQLILKKLYIPVIIIILLLATIHASALVMIPVIFIVQGKPWNKKTMLFICLVLLAILYLDRFTGLITQVMENTQYSNEVDMFLETEGTNIYRVLVFAIPPLASLIFSKYIQKANNPLINLCVNMSIISLGIYVVSAFTSGIFIGRIPIYFSLYNYILLPWLIDNVFERRTAKVVYGVMVVLYMAFYYYQVDVIWGL